MLSHIPMQRLILYILSLGLIPFVVVGFIFMSESSKVEELREALESLEHLVFIKEKKQALNLAVREHFKDADHFYIDKYLETLVFLEPETEQLQRIMQDRNFAEDERTRKRMEFLTGPSNALSFTEGVVQTFPFFQETSETLVHPVEVNVSDIQKILARVEGVKIGPFTPGPHRPQLFITEFKLDKKKTYDKNEVYLLSMKLIKREFS